MFIELIEKVREQPVPVKRQIVFLITVIFVFIVTVVWAIGFMFSIRVPEGDVAATEEVVQ